MDDSPADTAAETVSEAAPTPTVRVPRRGAGGAGVVTFIVILSLASYSILATVFIIVKLLTIPKPSTYPLLEAMPDAECDNPGVKKRSLGMPLQDDKVAELNREPVPERLRIGLGESVRVGDLEVTPLAVERRKVAVWVDTYSRPEPCECDSLVLTVRFRNRSKDYAFHPLDNFFDRNYEYYDQNKWVPRKTAEPMTILVAGERRFFGGPAVWVRRTDPKERVYRQWLDLPGRANRSEVALGPNETLESAVCTDGHDPRLEQLLDGYRGAFEWRVHVRRGLVDLGSREVSATAVVGVNFATDDIGKPPRADGEEKK
jgi:hypothetical protein